MLEVPMFKKRTVQDTGVTSIFCFSQAIGVICYKIKKYATDARSLLKFNYTTSTGCTE